MIAPKRRLVFETLKVIGRWVLAVLVSIVGFAAMIGVSLGLSYVLGRGVSAVMGTQHSTMGYLAEGGMVFLAAFIVMTFVAVVVRAAVRQARKNLEKP